MTPEGLVLGSGAVTFRQLGPEQWQATLGLSAEARDYLARGPVPGWDTSSITGATAPSPGLAFSQLQVAIGHEVARCERSRP